jgi:hypothetical protein
VRNILSHSKTPQFIMGMPLASASAIALIPEPNPIGENKKLTLSWFINLIKSELFTTLL